MSMVLTMKLFAFSVLYIGFTKPETTTVTPFTGSGAKSVWKALEMVIILEEVCTVTVALAWLRVA